MVPTQRINILGAIPSNCAILSTTVSSHMIQEIAKVENIYWEETLTGFKWLGNKCIELQEKKGMNVIFAYEEAIGYMVNPGLPDKDGISALAIFAEWTNFIYKERNLTLSSYLKSLNDKYGYFASINSYFTCKDPDLIRKIFNDIRTPAYPKTISGIDVLGVRDLTSGSEYDSFAADHQPSLPVSPSQMITFT